MLWYFGKIKNVNGKIESNHDQEVEDTAQADLKFENGLNCRFEASWNVKNYRLQETTIEIEGSLGKLRVNEDFIEISNHKDFDKKSITYRQELYTGVPIDVGGPEYTREDEDFLNCVQNNKQPMLNVNSSLQTQQVIDSIYKAASTNKIEEIQNE